MNSERRARPGGRAGRSGGLCPRRRCFVLRAPRRLRELTPMLSGHMPGGAHGILSLMTVVFVLPEGKCHCPRGVECACALALWLISSSPNPGC